MSDASHHPPVPAPPQPSSGYPAQPSVPPTLGAVRRRPWLPLVLVTAIIAGGLGVLATFLIMRSDTTGQDDVAIVCNEVEQIDFPLDVDELGLDKSLIWQLYGISTFATAAGIDDAHPGFERAGQELANGIQRVDVDTMDESLQLLSTTCGEVGR